MDENNKVDNTEEPTIYPSEVADDQVVTADEVNEESFGEKDAFMHDEGHRKMSQLSYTLPADERED